MKEFLRRILHKYDSRKAFFRTIPAQGRVLELGCGRGENCIALKELQPEQEIHGIDLLEKSEIPSFIQYRQHDLEAGALPYPDDYFDAILIVHVIEHLQKPINLSAEIHRLLKNGGKIYVETPNFTSIFVPSFGFRRDQHHPFNFFDDQGHKHPWTRQSLFEFIENSGLHVERVACTRNWLRIPFDLVGVIAGLIRRNRPQVVGCFWNLYGWNIFAIGTKLE